MLADARLAPDHFRRRARSNERVKTGNRAARDRDADEGKHRPGEDKPAAVDEFCNGGHLQRRIDQHDRDREHRHRAKFQKRAEIIARREQHPDGQNRRGESIDHDRPREPFLVLTKPGFNRREMAKKLSAPNPECQTEQSENRDRE